VKKKRKRKRSQKYNSDSESCDSDDSSSPLSYTYTNCDSVTLLNESQPLLRRLESDDDESSAPPPFQWLNWRMDPIKTFSDWIIDVVVVQRHRSAAAESASSLSSHRYHVHKNVLVVESQLFQDLFYKHQQPQDPLLVFTATQISLSNEYEANVFPTFLDYMYSPGSIWINQQNAITLLLLSNYFGMKRLNWLTKQFLKRHPFQKPDSTTTNAAKAMRAAKFDSPLRVSPHPPAATKLSSDALSCFCDSPNHLQQRESKIMANRQPVSNASSQASRAMARYYSDADLRMILSKKKQHSSDCILRRNPINETIKNRSF
jgi:BTB/POZ domain